MDGIWILFRCYDAIMLKVIKGAPVKNIDQISKPSDTEKLTINLGLIDLGQIDLLVQERFYTNRSDLIRTAIRNQLASHADVIKQTITRKSLVLGLQHYSRKDLEAARDAGQKLRIQALGLISIAQDVTPKLAVATIESITVLGALQASAAVKAALADRIH
jgi:Arc/MetJ-type ribon-helix-helix transcriptional regulator